MGSILSRFDHHHHPRNANDDDDTSLAEVGEVAAAESSRRAGESLPSPSLSVSVESKRRSPIDSRENKGDNPGTAPTKEKRRALALIKNSSLKSKNRGRTLQRGSRSANRNRPRAMKPNEERSRRSAKTVAAPIETKENDAQKRIAARESRNDRLHVRVPLDPITEKQNQVVPTENGPGVSSSSSAAAKGKKKTFRQQASYSLRRNGSKSLSTSSKDKATALAAKGFKLNENIAPRPTAKLPVDPPGAVLGALPWIHHSNHGQQQLVSSAQGTANSGHNSGHWGHYGGGSGHPAFPQPILPPMNNWGYQPMIAPFLAPFANFMANHGNYGYHDGGDHYAQTLHDVNNSQHSPHVEKGGNAEAEEDLMSVDESMKSDEETPPRSADTEEVKIKFIPSMFAPPAYVEEIKRRMEVAAKASSVIQTRSMTAKKSGNQRRDGIFRSNSANNKNSPRSKANAFAAHQACSPRSNLSRVGEGSGSKVMNAGTMAGSEAPEVMKVLGKRVTMVDPVRKVFIIDLLSPIQCDQIRMMADNHTREIHKSGAEVETWRTLYTYTKMDLPVVEVKDMVAKHTDGIMFDVKKIVGEIFGMQKEAMKLRPRSWKEPHLLLYQQLAGREPHTGIEMHYDGCDITWQAMLTRLDEYEGGGTYFRSLRKTVRLSQGQVLVHPGELYHKGVDITYGVRCLLVCFTDGMNPKILDDSKADEHKEEYEKNIVLY